MTLTASCSTSRGPQQSLPAPGADIVSVDGSIPWEGGLCLDLDLWDPSSGWAPLYSAGYDAAEFGQWSERQDRDFCKAAEVLDGAILLPSDAVAGTYRVCDPNCLVISYAPE